jgi:hypothetical protein
MAAGVIDLVLVGVILLAGYYVVKSGVLNTIAQPTPQQPITTAPTTTDGTGTGTGTDTTGTGTGTTTTPTPTTTDPLQQLIDQLLGQGGSNVLPTQPGAPVQQPIYQAPTYGGNPTECKSRYNGSCNTECSSGNQSLCNACQIACGGAQIGAVQTLPPMGGTTNPQLCQSRFNGKCNTECSSGNNSECQACKAACGSFGAYAYYVQAPQSLMASSVFRNTNHSYNASWPVNVQNAR